MRHAPDARAVASGETKASSPPPVEHPTQRLLLLDERVARVAMGIGVVGAGSGAVLTLVHAGHDARLLQGTWAYGLLALTLAACTTLPVRWLRHAVALWLMAVVVLVAARSVQFGWGLAAPGWTLPALAVCITYVLSGRGHGVAMTLVAVAALVAVAMHTPAPPGQNITLLVGTHLVVVLVGLGSGIVIGHIVERHTTAAAEREQRFRRLLALATDAYWEIDAGYRLLAATEPQSQQRRLHPSNGLGQRPWDLARFGCAPHVLDELLADLDRRRPFRDRPVSWADGDGPVRHYLASGEPRFDAAGVFCGYWGVARDVTDVQAARAALQATETRYQELFTRIPTPLVLHRQQVIDANPAALAMFGHADLASMAGGDLHAAFAGGDSRERARRRTEELAASPVGTALPVADFKLQVQDRTVAVRATGVRVDAPGGAATLAIFVDDTERLAAEEAVRRSEALLSHLVATSPDLITLTDRDSGRYVMVNQAFERVSGWRMDEVIGRTSVELGVWGSDEARRQFIATLDATGVVSDLPIRFVRRDGGPLPLLVSAARFVMDRRDYIVINGRDISERERSRLEREAILSNVSIGIAVMRDGRFTLTNPPFDRMFGWPAGTLTGQPAHVLWDDAALHEKTGRQVRRALARGGTADFEARGRRRDGSTFTAHVRGSTIDPAYPTQAGTVWIVQDVTERRAAEQALARARDDAEAASRAKSAFLANTSHELRTPLNGLIGLAHLARQPDVAEALRAQYLAQIADIAQALAAVISDILDVSKIEAGKLQLEHTVFDLGELMETLASTYGLLALSHPTVRLRFEVDAAARGPVRGDPVRVRQVVGNFVGNALKFTTAGEVAVTARRLAGAGADGDDGRVRIEVRDTGPGIDEPTQQRLFEPFMQADQSTTRRFGGTGLGLSIARELAQLMGGQVGVSSAPGRGSTFWAELPLPRAAVLPPPQPPAPEATLHGARVLMAEDNAVNMMIAVAMLQRWGVAVTPVTDGHQAVAAVVAAHAAGRPFDAVLMDVQMPVMSGHEATRQLRVHAAGAQLPVIALTAAALVTEREEALRAGMNDFLTKPIEAERLRATLLRWCGRAPAAPAPNLF